MAWELKKILTPEEAWNSLLKDDKFETEWGLSYPYETEKLPYLPVRQSQKHPIKTPFLDSFTCVGSIIHHGLYLKRFAALWVRVIFPCGLDLPLWCSQLFLIFMKWCFSLLQIQSIWSLVTRTRRMPYILWTVNKSVNWLFCSQNAVTTGINWHSNLDFCFNMSLL